MGIPQIKLRRIGILASMGTFIEWYDFFIAGIAASLVWPTIFFPSFDPAAALAFSISTYAVTFFARPIAALIFGHFGDRLGRRHALLWTMACMSIAMFGIAAIPPYASIGILAGVLVAIFRFIQGFGIGGEWQGAITFIAEYAANKKTKAFWSALPQIVNPVGILLGLLAFYLTQISMDRETFLSIGWRIPFIIGGLVVIFGLILRYRFLETPLFNKLITTGQIARMPAIEVFKEDWRNILLLSGVISYVVAVFNITLVPVGLSYLAAQGMRPPLNTIIGMLSALASTVLVTIGAIWADFSKNRKTPILISILLTLILLYPYYLLINTKSFVYILIAAILIPSLTFLGYGVFAIFTSELFPTKFRYSAVGYSLQLGAVYTGFILVFLVPYLATIAGSLANAWLYLLAINIGMLIISLVCLLFIKFPKKDYLTEAL